MIGPSVGGESDDDETIALRPAISAIVMTQITYRPTTKYEIVQNWNQKCYGPLNKFRDPEQSLEVYHNPVSPIEIPKDQLLKPLVGYKRLKWF